MMSEAISVSTMDLSGLAWRKSSRSGQGNNNACVEVAFSGQLIAVRDSKNSAAGVLAFPKSSWTLFLG